MFLYDHLSFTSSTTLCLAELSVTKALTAAGRHPALHHARRHFREGGKPVASTEHGRLKENGIPAFAGMT
jgi:hypothetical protein